MQGVIPIGVRCEKVWIDVPVSSAWGGAGQAVADATDSISVTLFNGGAVPIEYRVGSGAWTQLEVRNSDMLELSLASTTIRLRKARSAGYDGVVSLLIESLTSSYVVDGHAIDLGNDGGDGNGGGGAVTYVATVVGDTTLNTTHYTVLVDATDGNTLISLPTAASALSNGVGRVYNVKKIDASANTVTIGNGAEVIDDQVTVVLDRQWQSVTIQSNGTSWSLL